MATYRAYLLSPSGRIMSGAWVEAETQAEAEAKALALCSRGTPTVELWQGANFLATLPCGAVEESTAR
jgi:hypothetical protein